MPKLVCVNCQTEYKIAKTGGWVIEMFGDPPKPYKIWSADGWECSSCGSVVMAGFPHKAMAEYYEDDFEDNVKRVKKGDTADQGWLIYDYEKAR